jgi:presenilin-like A22 family membrane protease
MGDLIMPSILVVSATVFLTTPTLLGFISIPSVGAMAGSLAGLVVLINLVVQGRPQAGLPALNGGAITGFLLGCALTGTWSWIPGI